MATVLEIFPVVAMAVLGQVSPDPQCASAKKLYESLEVEKALTSVDQTLQTATDRPLPCLEIKALCELVMGSPQGATTLEELFTRDPEYRIEDPSLSPAMRDAIERARGKVDVISVRPFARWLSNGRLRLDVRLTGKSAARVRYSAATAPAGERFRGEIPIVGDTATATVTVIDPRPVDQLNLSGVVLDPSGAVRHEFGSLLTPPPRPPPALASQSRLTEPAPPEAESESSLWWLWASIGAATVAGAATAAVLLTRPGLPDTAGTVGRMEIGR